MKRALLLGALLWASSPALAEAPPEAEPSLEAALAEDAGATIAGQVPGTPPDAATVDRLTQAIAVNLRCPVCQGLSVNDSTSPAAVAMQRRVRELVAAGYSRDQIETYFIGKYGEWVLLAPRNEGLNQIAWLGPLAALVLGAGVLFLATRRRDPVPDDAPSPPPSAPAPDAPLDDYARALLAEVDDD